MNNIGESIWVFIENEAGSATKRTYDEKTLEFLRCDQVSSPYPFAYGFILDTLSGDGDCLDCFVVSEKQFEEGTRIECVPVHLLEQIEDDEVDHKVLAVPLGTPLEVDGQAVDKIRSFIGSVFSHIPGKSMQLGQLLGASEAWKYVKSCQRQQ